ncbi:hypothetical protein [Burkholderia ubonensis]|uniref:hypothetical protein n=1 Tax=Burkholderia ubonensis TaxID=101571 RepID=UPI000AE903A3|nr:hypothetical protein [Burkholderia ubonensis]
MKLASLLILIALTACAHYDGPPNIGVGGVWNTDDHVANGGNGSAGVGSAGRGTSGNARGGASGGMGHGGPGRG